jgi:erythromycin esterase-like protein
MASSPSARRVVAFARSTFLALTIACGADGADFTQPPITEPPVVDGPPNSPLGDAAIETIRGVSHPITGADGDYDALLAAIGDARVVVLGEATHGTEEFQRERARITRRLVLEKGFTAVAIEGGWPETEAVNDWIRGRSAGTAEHALAAYTEFPAWMWRNARMRDLVVWLRAHDDGRPDAQDVGIYGLDVSGLVRAADRVIEYLAAVDADLASHAAASYACFDPYRSDLPAYGSAAAAGAADCRDEAAAVRDAMARLAAAAAPADPAARDALFSALRNAHTVVNGEEYFRNLHTPGQDASKARDARMAEALVALEEHIAASAGTPARVVVWTHSTLAGEAAASGAESTTEPGLAQLIRARLGGAAVLVGLQTYVGTVRAADTWGGPGRVVELRPALPESFSDAFHRAAIPNFMLIMDGPGALRIELRRERRELAVGPVYLPGSEHRNRYAVVRPAQELDAVIFLDTTHAVSELP